MRDILQGLFFSISDEKMHKIEKNVKEKQHDNHRHRQQVKKMVQNDGDDQKQGEKAGNPASHKISSIKRFVPVNTFCALHI